MATYYWENAYSCKECANIHSNPLSNFCAICGSRDGHARVAIKIKMSWLSSKIVEVRLDRADRQLNSYIKNLASILELDVDGEGSDGPAAYLADAMGEAILSVNKHR